MIIPLSSANLSSQAIENKCFLLKGEKHLKAVCKISNAKVEASIPVWTIHLRAGLHDPGESFPIQNVLWFFEKCCFNNSKTKQSFIISTHDKWKYPFKNYLHKTDNYKIPWRENK